MKNYLIFGGLKSLDYFVWIDGGGTYGAPRRSVEYVSVPGRNGDLIIDGGKWENIEVTYDAFIPKKFPQKINDFRMALCNKLGYQRLEDTYHPDEYRLASFEGAIEPVTTQWNRGGTFSLVFNCKPQRYLKSGEEPLQFMPPVTLAGSMNSGYMPCAGPLNYKVHCAAGEDLTVEVVTYDSTGTQRTTTTEYCGDGDEHNVTFATADKYFRIRVSNIESIDTTWLEVVTSIEYGGDTIPVNAIFTRNWTIQNPTGYTTEPMIESFGSMLPFMTITNYIDGEAEDFYDFHSNQQSQTHIWMDCDLQYLYDDNGDNLTQYLFLTTAETAAGKGLVFPKLGPDEIKLQFYYSGAAIEQGAGLIQIYPRWWKL